MVNNLPYETGRKHHLSARKKTGNATEYPCGITCRITDTGESLSDKFFAVTGVRASVFTFRHDLF